MLPIIQAPADILSMPAKRVGRIDKSIRDLIREMTVSLENAKDPEGIGLAAPQVGKPLQLFIIKQSPEAKVSVFINPILKAPEILIDPEKKKSKKKKGVKLEGCLSLQDIWGIVKRHPHVTLTFLDEQGKRRTRKFTGFFATIIQHEYDHLQGILFPKRVLEQQEKLYKSSRDKNGETVFEEIEI